MSVGKKRAPRLGRGLSSLMSKPVAIDPPAGDAPPAVREPRESAAPGASVESPASPAALTAPAEADAPRDGLFHVELDSIARNPSQPRQHFDEAALQGLADSIRAEGVMQPIVLRPIKPADDAAPRYEIVAGERRWRAARLAGLQRIPALVRELADQQVAEWALIENLQREDLNPLERAEAFHRLAQDFHLSHDDIAARLGLQRSSVTNLLRLLSLSPAVQELVRDGLLSMGQARALAGLPAGDAQSALAVRIVREAMSVRQAEDMVRKILKAAAVDVPAARTPSGRQAHLVDLERQLAEQLGTKVRLTPGRKKGSGSLTIEFYDLDQFDALLSKLGVNAGE